MESVFSFGQRFSSYHSVTLDSLHTTLSLYFYAVPNLLLSQIVVFTDGGMTNFRSKPAVIQESVSVSTVTCHDASTQTPVHAETQTNLSTVSLW